MRVLNLFVTNKKGYLLLLQQYTSLISHFINEFHRLINDNHKKNDKHPIVVSNSEYIFCFITKSNLFLVATLRQKQLSTQINVMMIITFLHTIVNSIKKYFKIEFNENNILLHKLPIIELIHELCDDGIPQSICTKALQLQIPQQISSDKNDLGRIIPCSGPLPPWRNYPVTHVTNEINLQMEETVNFVFDMNKNVIDWSINGFLNCNPILNGIPIVKINFEQNIDPKTKTKLWYNLLCATMNIPFKQLKCHRCVMLHFPRNKKTHDIEFIPPDNMFTILQYEFNGFYKYIKCNKMLFDIDCYTKNNVFYGKQYDVILSANFDEKYVANNVVLTIPVRNN
eukprot:132000_1